VPPPWAFGLWKSRDVHHNQDSVMVDLDKLRRYEIPASVLVIDSPWETGYNNFEVNTQQFPDAEAMFARIQEMGFYLCFWLTPFINSRNVIDMVGVTDSSSNFVEATQAGHLVEDSDGNVAESDWWKGRGGLVDFTDPAAIDWWMTQLAKTKKTGVRAFKVDDGEGNFVPDAVFHDGTPAWKMKNRYGVLYDSVMQAYVDEHLDGNGVLITRTGYTGTQRFPFAWAGDNRGDFSFGDGLPSVILAGQNAAMSGIALWGSDIAGYAGTPSKEVFIRWTQVGAFSPFMQVHMTSNLGPWDFDAETLHIFQKYTRLRNQLFPYLYNAAHEAARTGLPIIRPMAFAFPDDAEAHRHIYQYLYGPDLLVAPMYQPGTQRAVYLPAGTWYDYWTGERYVGPQTIVVDAPLETMPLFVRSGALLPMLPSDVQTLIARHDEMDPGIVALDDRRILHVWPGVSGNVATWDGLSATLSGNTLHVASTVARPLEIHLLHRRIEMEAPAGASVRYNAEANKTVITFERFDGSHTLSWQEVAR
ncbi:MAG TPA: glycoside hydrolase family 31 protein, partial [Rhodothermales bacterium]|nr:glycoside hydrolase family 31 protein [Rhodothermales bacterium]